MYKIFLLLMLFSNTITAQNISRFERTTSDTLPERFKVDVPELRKQIYKRLPQDFEKEEDEKSIYRFSHQSALQISTLFSSGIVYSDWSLLEDYVNKVMDKIMPEELKGDSLIHVYITKEPKYNAFMTGSGKAFINIGVFSEIKNEATLAAILAHELAHYYLEHSLNSYVKSEGGDFNPGIFMSNKNAYSQFSIQNEISADDLAMVWLNNSGYSIQGAIASLGILNKMEANNLLRYKDRWEPKEVTHPGAGKRIEKLNQFYEEKILTPGELFLIDETAFYKFKISAKREILNGFLSDFQYNKCIETAFKFHLYDPSNSIYIYYLMEGIRRSCYLNTSNWNKNFINYRYYEIVEEENRRYKRKRTKHIFEGIQEDVLAFSEDDVKDIKAGFYWNGDPKFTTNEEAFMFFNSVGKLLKEPECMLSNALSYSFDLGIRDSILKQYLAYPKIRYRDYANSLINDRIKSNLENKTMTIMSDFYVTIRLGKEEIFIENKNESECNSLREITAAATKEFDNRKFMLLSDLQSYQMNDYVLYKELESLSLMTIYAKGDKTEIFILDPKFWQVLNRLKVNEIEFVNFSYFDARKGDKSLGTYEAIIDTDVSELLLETKRRRFMDALISSVRVMDGGVMKIKYFGKEESLEYKDASYEQIIKFINIEIKRKDHKAEEFDRRY